MSISTETDVLCSTCAGASLRPIIEEDGTEQRCTTCGEQAKCVSGAEVARTVYEAFARFYAPEYPAGAEEGYQGAHPLEVVRRLIGPDAPEGLAEVITNHLEQQERAGVIGGYGPHLFIQSAHYEWAGRAIGGHAFNESWPEFREYIMHRGRYFDPLIDNYLDGVLAEITNALEGVDPELPVGTRIYRARLINEGTAGQITDAPAKELGPAPRGKRSGGRLNAPGMAVFYAAFDPETAIAELRPPVGSLVALGAFETSVPLKILDLTQLSLAHVNLLLPGAEEQVDALDFMRVFHEVITRPSIDGEHASYIPTQVLAEYLRWEGAFEGLIYRSVQVGKLAQPQRDTRNIAIFDAEGILDNGERRATDNDHRSGFRVPESKVRLRFVDGSLRFRRVRAADYLTMDVVDMGDYLIDLDELMAFEASAP